MTVIDTGLTTAGVRSEFFARFNLTPQYYLQLATRIGSTTDVERQRFLGTVPQMREWGSGRLCKGLRAESYDIANLKYEATLEVDRDEISDDQTGQIRLRIGELAVRAATHKDYLISQLLIHGAEADCLAYDGKPFFSAAHESGASGVQNNIMTAAAANDDDPTTAEFRTALRAAIARMMGFKDDQGEPMLMIAGDLWCIVPPTMFFNALEAISSTILQDGTTNIIKGIANVIAFPRLTVDASKWYLLSTNAPVRPFIFQDREPIEFGSLEQDSDAGFKAERFLFGVRARYRMAYGYWQYAVSIDMTA